MATLHAYFRRTYPVTNPNLSDVPAVVLRRIFCWVALDCGRRQLGNDDDETDGDSDKSEPDDDSDSEGLCDAWVAAAAQQLLRCLVRWRRSWQPHSSANLEILS